MGIFRASRYQPFIGGGSLLTLDGAAHDAQRKVVAPAFHSRHYGAYMMSITRSVASVSDTWNMPATTTTSEAAVATVPRVFYKDAREMTFRMACSLVLGLELGPAYAQLNADWNELFSGIMDPVRANLPFTPYGRSMAAKRRVDAFLRQLVAERRAAPGTDLVSLLLDVRQEDGTPLSENELVDQARLLLFAAFDTTASTMTWLLAELLQHPEAYARRGGRSRRRCGNTRHHPSRPHQSDRVGCLYQRDTSPASGDAVPRT
ncbi:MAG: cytochrome P450 [Ktedonobacterales bacterium]